MNSLFHTFWDRLLRLIFIIIDKVETGSQSDKLETVKLLSGVSLTSSGQIIKLIETYRPPLAYLWWLWKEPFTADLTKSTEDKQISPICESCPLLSF